MNGKIELKKSAREFVRWVILRMLYAGGPGGVSEITILRVVQTMDLDCELDDVRQDMDYMRSAGLAEVGPNGPTGCRVRLTARGVAVVEYSARAPSGVGRPRRWHSSKKTTPRLTVESE